MIKLFSRCMRADRMDEALIDALVVCVFLSFVFMVVIPTIKGSLDAYIDFMLYP